MGSLFRPFPKVGKIGIIEVQALAAESAKFGKPLTSVGALAVLYRISAKGVSIAR